MIAKRTAEYVFLYFGTDAGTRKTLRELLARRYSQRMACTAVARDELRRYLSRWIEMGLVECQPGSHDGKGYALTEQGKQELLETLS